MYNDVYIYTYIYIHIYIYIHRENVFGRPTAFADWNALSVYTVEHKHFYGACETCPTWKCAQRLWSTEEMQAWDLGKMCEVPVDGKEYVV